MPVFFWRFGYRRRILKSLVLSLYELLENYSSHSRRLGGVVRCAWQPFFSILPLLYITRMWTFSTVLMRLLYCFWQNLGEFQISTDIPVSKAELKTSNVVNSVWKYCVVNAVKLLKSYLRFWWNIMYDLFETNIF